MSQILRRLAVVIPLVAGVTVSVLPGAGAMADRPHHESRPLLRSLAPKPDFLIPCVLVGANSHACVTESVAAIDNGRRAEGLSKRLVLPHNFVTLTPAEQAFVVVNLERVDRGLRPFAGMVARLNRAARAAAMVQVDPNPARSLLLGLGVHMFKTIWADDYGVLGSNYEWMYDDGYAGWRTTNVGCRYRGAPDCWAHRAGILTPFTGLPVLLAGFGSERVEAGARSVAAVLTGGHGRRPHFTYSWREALRHGADGHRSR